MTNPADIPSSENRRPERFYTQPAGYNAEHHDLGDWTAVVDVEDGGVVAYFAYHGDAAAAAAAWEGERDDSGD